MSKRQMTLANALVGIIIVVVTLVVFFVGFSSRPKETIDYVALVFILISEVAFFAGLISVLNLNREKMSLIKLSIVSTLFMYLVVTILIGLYFMNRNNNLYGLITTNSILIGIVAILIILLSVANANINSSNESIIKRRIVIQDCELKVYGLLKDSRFEAYYEGLNKLYETIKYSDKVSANKEGDIKIHQGIIKFSEYLNTDEVNEEMVNKKLKELIGLVEQRNMLLKELKRGSF